MSTTFDAMEFDTLEPTVIPVRIGNKAYLLREADEAACVNYRNTAARAARFNAEGNLSGVEGAANVEPMLVSACLYEADAADVNDVSTYTLRLTADHKVDPKYRVPEAIIRTMRGSIIAQLFDRVKDISGMDDKPTEENLTKQIDKLTKQRDKLRSLTNNKGDEAKNGLDGSTDTLPTA